MTERLQVISDVHCEFMPDFGAGFAKRLPAVSLTLVLAGDIIVLKNQENYRPFFDILAKKFDHVVWIMGNHEGYGLSAFRMESLFRAFSRTLPENIHALNDEILELGDHRILATPLWFPAGEDNARYQRYMADFSEIEHLYRWVYPRAAVAYAFLKNQLKRGDIVVTHHLPSVQSVPAKYVGSNLNRFFVHPCDTLIRDREPAVWIHGHTHGSCEYTIGKTKVVCNPYGYEELELNPSFWPHFTVEVP